MTADPTNFEQRKDGSGSDAATHPSNADLPVDALFSEATSTEIRRRYEAAKQARQHKIEGEMLADLRRREGEYDEDKKAKLEAAGGGSMVFDNITDPKCSGGESMLADLFFFSGARVWGLDPTPIPDLDDQAESKAIRAAVEAAMNAGINPEQAEDFDDVVAMLKDEIRKEIESEAKKRAEGMERLIADQFAEGGFDAALNDFITDLVTHKIGALMGPCPRMVKQLVAVGTEIQVQERLVLGVERISPLDIYPAALSVKPADGDFFVRRRISSDAAVQLGKIKGVKADALQQALARHGGAVQEIVDTESASISAKTMLGGDTETDPAHELIYWWHWMSRREIAHFDRTTVPEDLSAQDMVPMTGLMLNGVVIKAVENLDATGAPNVFIASFRRRPGSIWGIGLSGLAKSQQDQVNVFARALNINAHHSAQARYEAEQDKLVDPAALTKSFPGQVIYRHPAGPGDTRRAVELIETPNYTAVLLNARNQAAAWLDEKSGVFPQSIGDPAQAGAAKTLGGLQILRQDQTKTLKRTLAHISEAIGGLVRAFWLWNMLFSDDESIKGDMKPVARGPVQLYLTSEDVDTLLAVLDLLTKTPQAQNVVKPNAIAYLLREIIRMRRLDPDKIIQTDAELEQAMEAARAAQAKPAEAAGTEDGERPAEAVAAKPESESALMRAQADMIRARAMEEKNAIERERLVGENAERVTKIRRAQQEIAARRQQTGGIFAPRPIPVPAEQAPEPIPSMGGEA